jgi:hypothetical protein
VTRTHTRHNVVALAADYALFMTALAFVSPSTILPAFAAWLGAPNVVIGAIPAVMTLGWVLPCLFAAPYTEGLSRKLPFLIRWTIWERVPFVVLAASAYWLAERSAGAALAMLLTMLLVVTGIGGLLMPAWMDLIGRVVPVTRRGRFFAVSGVVASVAGLGASVITADLLSSYRPAVAYALCFVCATVCLVVSFVALVVVREPAAIATRASEPLGVFLRRIPTLLREDRNLAWYLVARSLSALGTAGVVANAIALAATSPGVFGFVFVLAGVQTASATISGLNVLLEFAPATETQPTYVGLGHTSLAPMAVAAPIGAGAIADAAGFPAVFVIAALGGIAATLVLALRVRDPRHARTMAAAESGA